MNKTFIFETLAWILGFLFYFPIVIKPLTIQSLGKYNKLNLSIADLISHAKTNKATQFFLRVTKYMLLPSVCFGWITKIYKSFSKTIEAEHGAAVSF